MKTKGKVIPRWLSKYLDLVENIFFLGRLESFWEKLVGTAELKEGEHVLDVGCGSGRLTLELAKKVGPSGRIEAIDASPAMIEACVKQEQYKHYPINFQVGVMEQLNFPDNSFDIVVSSLALHHVPKREKEKALLEFKRVLKPNGRVIILDHGEVYKWWLKPFLYPLRWNIGEYQAENFRGKIPGMIKNSFGNVEEKCRFYGWIRIWKALKN